MINKVFNFLFPSLLVLFVISQYSCENELKFSDVKSLREYVSETENGLKIVREDNNYHFEVSYVPTDILVNIDMNAYRSKETDVESLRKKYDEYYYFQLSMTYNGHSIERGLKGGVGEYRVLKEKLIYGLDDRIFMSTKNSDSIGIADYIYPRLYGLNHSTNILFFFKRENILRDDQILVVNLKDVGVRNRKLKFPFNKEKVQRNMKIDFK